MKEFNRRRGNSNDPEPTGQRKTAPREAGEKPRGVSKPQPEQAKPKEERGERQPGLVVWDILEREVRLHAADVEDRPRRESQEYNRKFDEVARLEEELLEKGTTRENLILRLSTAIRYEPAGLPLAAWYRHLSLKEFQQFRSRVEPLSNEEIREVLRKQEEENKRMHKELFGVKRIWPPSNSAANT